MKASGKEQRKRPFSPGYWSLLGVYFLLGGFLGAYNLEPVRSLVGGFQATVELYREMTQDHWFLLSESRYKGDGLRTYDPPRAQPGLTLVQGLMPGGAQVRLYSIDGKELHRWPVDFFKVWPDPQHIVPDYNIPKSEWGYHTQGFSVNPDWSIVVTFGDLGAAKLDACGNPIWKVDHMIHHSVTRDPDGGYWFPDYTPIPDLDEALLPPGMSRDELMQNLDGKLDFYAAAVLKVDADGRPQQEFSVLKALVDAKMEDLLFDGATYDPSAPIHLNDVELVTPALAAKIDGVSEGDLLVSLRTMHTLAILSRKDGHILWHKTGPWVRQHDPDIMPDGTIEIFNNRGWAAGRFVDGSQILSYDPATDKTTVLVPMGDADQFESDILGTHQRLANGDFLIAESRNGRVFEVTPSGDVVWDMVIPFDETYASLVEMAQRVPDDFFDTPQGACPN